MARPRSKLYKLLRLRELTTLEHFDCDSVMDGTTLVGAVSRGAEVTATAFVVERTRLYRESWMLPLLDELIASEQAKRQKRKER